MPGTTRLARIAQHLGLQTLPLGLYRRQIVPMLCSMVMLLESSYTSKCTGRVKRQKVLFSCFECLKVLILMGTCYVIYAVVLEMLKKEACPRKKFKMFGVCHPFPGDIIILFYTSDLMAWYILLQII